MRTREARKDLVRGATIPLPLVLPLDRLPLHGQAGDVTEPDACVRIAEPQRTKPSRAVWIVAAMTDEDGTGTSVIASGSSALKNLARILVYLGLGARLLMGRGLADGHRRCGTSASDADRAGIAGVRLGAAGATSAAV